MLGLLFCFASCIVLPDKKKARKVVIPMKNVEGLLCDMCQELISEIETMVIEQIVEEEIIEAADEFCESLIAPISTICSEIVDQYITAIIDFLEQGLESLDICTRIGLCDSQAVKIKKVKKMPVIKSRLPKTRMNNDIICDLCTQLVNYVEELLVSGSTEEEIEELVGQLCTTMPAPLSTICSAIVDQYIPVIMEWIEQEIEALDICVKLGLCSGKANKNVRFPKSMVPKPNGFACDVCTHIVELVETALNSSVVESEIILLVDSACELIPAPGSSICEVIADLYVPKIISLLESGLESADICSIIGFCSVRPVGKALLKARIPKSIRRKSRNDLMCDICKTIVEYIEEVMTSTTVEEEIIEAVEEVCDTMVAPFSTMCDMLVAEYIPMIMQLIEEGFESLDICSTIGLCATRKGARRGRKLGNFRDGIVCTVCQTVVSYVEELMVSTTVESEIIAAVDALCDTMPSPLSTICDTMVAQFVPTIMQWLEEGVESLDICVNLGLCDSLSHKISLARHPGAVKQIKKMLVLRRK